MDLKYKKRLLIDLDRVLNEYKGDFDKNFIPPAKTGTREFLKTLSADYEIKIFTTRNKLLSSKWLIENNLDEFISDVTNIKEPAYLHVDDRCICFRGNFQRTINEIKIFKTYYK